jgi:large subunit ribosomal protein L32e
MARKEFVRQESWRYSRVGASWRRPRGISSKMRLRRKGWPKVVDIGYRGPRKQRGLHPSGLREVLVHNEKDLEGLNPALFAVRIAHAVGKRKRQAILAKAKQLGLRVLNPVL